MRHLTKALNAYRTCHGNSVRLCGSAEGSANLPEPLSVAQLVEHVTVDVCDHRVAGSIPAAETFLFGTGASLAQSVERKALNLVVVGSSPTGGGFWEGTKGLSRELNPGPLAP